MVSAVMFLLGVGDYQASEQGGKSKGRMSKRAVVDSDGRRACLQFVKSEDSHRDLLKVGFPRS